MKSGVWACELVPQFTPYHPTHPGELSIAMGCAKSFFPFVFTHWQTVGERKINPIELQYIMIGGPVSFDTSHLCKTCHQILHQHETACPKARTEARELGQERKRKIAEAKDKRDSLLTGASKSGKNARVCERFVLGLCFNQMTCQEVHPDNDPTSYKEITCALEEPTAERKRKIGDWPFCKKGEKCLYSHEKYGEASVIDGLQEKVEPTSSGEEVSPPTPQPKHKSISPHITAAHTLLSITL